MTFCTDRYTEGQAPPFKIFMRSAKELVAPIAQQEPLHAKQLFSTVAVTLVEEGIT